MRLTDASVAIRPRTAWEAMDLGVLLARRHAGLLMASWALVTLPVFLLLSALFWDYPGLAILLFWLGKPAYERLPLFILSRALFGDTPSLGEALRAYPRLLRPQLVASLTWRRFSPTRSFDLPVIQLERLAGQTRSQRLVVLGQRDAGGATWLTVIGMHLELALWLGLITLFYLMLPQQMTIEWNWDKVLEAASGEWLWLEHLSNSLYALVLIIWEPVYVACGFTLYLNRRTALEAWDIELEFRRLRQRLTGAAYALLLALGLGIAHAPQPAQAQENIGVCPAPPAYLNGPETERLSQQALDSASAREDIKTLLDSPPFQNRETVTRWRLGNAAPETPADGSNLEGWASLLRDLFKLAEYWRSQEMLTLALKALLWGLVFSLIALFLWRYRDWLNTFAGRLGLPQRHQQAQPPVLFGLELAPESLPEDVASEAERLWSEQPREALGLLYRALLSRLLHDFRLPLKASHTEGEVLQMVIALDNLELEQFSQAVTRHWQNLAYGHQLPPGELRQGLCDGWRHLFAKGSTA
ncbi:DUF4129 domain-containing protein [Metapseudomonas boanensis]|uniref:DUF4129 domain-containing protein n=1 Tax=Metapseudomonas boanensis TaxID=2822138 RepID=A0ABS5XEN1_9GAMM|nr:DUF4129 domain-containing protein [Pseudomonas boanensis]MBT8766136.1 DUF4129 domain-containing protein [Pseudomonas boanensis]